MPSPTIEHLNAAQLARHAFNVFLFSGRHETGARLIFRSLELQPHDPLALRCLSDFFDAEGTEMFSAVVLEYALSEKLALGTEDRKTLDDLLFLSKWTWGFARHSSGSPHLAQADFADRSAFTMDAAGYGEFLGHALGPAGSLEAGFRAAHTLCGAMAGLLQHRDLGGKAGFDEAYHPEQFQKSAAYDEWLRTTTEELDELEKARREKSKPVARPWWKFWASR